MIVRVIQTQEGEVINSNKIFCKKTAAVELRKLHNEKLRDKLSLP